MIKSIAEIIEEKLGRSDLELPVYSPVASRITAMLADDDFDIVKLEKLIVTDQALAGSVLKTANSAFFSGLGTVTTIREALMRLGSKQVSNMVILVTQKQNFGSPNPMIAGYLKKLWDHSVATAIGANWLATKLGYRTKASEAFLAGLLHDFGMLFLLKVLDDAIRENGDLEFTKPVVEEILLKMHTGEGEKLMTLWNLPEMYREVAKLHHTDTGVALPALVNIVRLADIVASRLGITIEDPGDILPASTIQAITLGAGEVTIAELEIAIEDAVGLANEL